MATPSNKSGSVEKLLAGILGAIGDTGMDRRTCIINDVCTFCNAVATEFRDELSRKEFTISGLCQKCQDETFGVSDE